MLIDPARIDVDVADGVVTMTGRLDTPRDAELAVRLVESVEGGQVDVNLVELTHRQLIGVVAWAVPLVTAGGARSSSSSRLWKARTVSWRLTGVFLDSRPRGHCPHRRAA